jgi:ABC-2 type transport system permease protein
VKAAGPEAVASVQILVWPISFLSTVFLDPATMPGWLGWLAEWNPISATAEATRALFGNPTVAGTTWASEHALLLAVAWPAVLVAVSLPLAVRSYRRLGD